MNAGSPEETRQLGRELASKLCPGQVVALIGELGAGKTTFTQGIFEGLGIKENATSPSFVIINEYRLPAVGRSPHAATVQVYHVDLFRLESSGDIEDLGIEDLINNDSILIVEWAEKMGDLLPKACVKIYFEIAGENERKIEIKTQGLAAASPHKNI